MAKSPAAESLADLEHFISTIPIIDNHAHNIYNRESLKTEDLLTITTEASEQALDDTRTSLPHLRAAKQLCKLYDLPVEADWRAIVRKRTELLNQDPDTLIQKCLENTQTMLIDDGFDDTDVLEPYNWHNKFTYSPCKRLIRIEELASDILSSLHDQKQLPTGNELKDEGVCSRAWATFLIAFEAAVGAAIESSEVAGFKAAICFTSGLAITVGPDSEVSQSALRSF